MPFPHPDDTQESDENQAGPGIGHSHSPGMVQAAWFTTLLGLLVETPHLLLLLTDLRPQLAALPNLSSPCDSLEAPWLNPEE